MNDPVGDATVDDEGDASLSSEDPRSSPDVVFSKVPSLDLIWGDISLFYGAACLGSLRHLRDAAEAMYRLLNGARMKASGHEHARPLA
jgi:hypothetical protein